MQVGVSDHPFGTGLDIERAVLDPLDVELALAPSTDEETLAELARQSVGLLVCYAPIPRGVIAAAAAGGCKVISRYGIGYDNVDVAAATEAGIVVTNVPDYCLDEVADHTFALLLGAARGVVRAAETVRGGEWVPGSVVHSLQGRQLSLVRIGRIGAKVAQRARLRVCASSRTTRSCSRRARASGSSARSRRRSRRPTTSRCTCRCPPRTGT